MDKFKNGIALRKETLVDGGFLLEVYGSTRQEEMKLVDWADDQKEAFLTMQFNAQHRYYLENYPGAEFQIVMWDRKPAGRLYVHKRENEIRIMDITLLPEYRNLGIGTKLLKDILEQGRQFRLPVTIHVERSNPALSLYQRLGFQLEEDKGVYLLLKWSALEAEH